MTGWLVYTLRMIHVGMIFSDIFTKKTHFVNLTRNKNNIKFLAGEWTNFTVTKD